MSLEPPARDSGPSLTGLRDAIERLVDPDGRYRIASAATGLTSVPVDGATFPDRPTAELAARFASAYRDRLHRWDERTPHCDLIVHEGPSGDRCTGQTRPQSCFDADIVRPDAGTNDE